MIGLLLDIKYAFPRFFKAMFFSCYAFFSFILFKGVIDHKDFLGKMLCFFGGSLILFFMYKIHKNSAKKEALKSNLLVQIKNTPRLTLSYKTQLEESVGTPSPLPRLTDFLPVDGVFLDSIYGFSLNNQDYSVLVSSSFFLRPNNPPLIPETLSFEGIDLYHHMKNKRIKLLT